MSQEHVTQRGTGLGIYYFTQIYWLVARRAWSDWYKDKAMAHIFIHLPTAVVIYYIISILTWAYCACLFILWKSHNCRANSPSRTQLPYLGCQWYLAVSNYNQDSVFPKCLTLRAVSFIKEVQETIVESQPSRVHSHFSMRQKPSQQILKKPASR